MKLAREKADLVKQSKNDLLEVENEIMYNPADTCTSACVKNNNFYTGYRVKINHTVSAVVIMFAKKGIEVAEKSIKKCNNELGEATKGKNLSRDKIILCQSKITMRLKRETELN